MSSRAMCILSAEANKYRLANWPVYVFVAATDFAAPPDQKTLIHHMRHGDLASFVTATVKPLRPAFFSTN